MQKSRVIIVEDELLIAEDIHLGLEGLGYEIVAVSVNSEDALRDVRQHRPDVVLMDILLQGKSVGIQTADAIRREFDVPVIYLTSYSDKKTLEQAKITEPYGYSLKPFHTEALQSVIEMALYKHRIEKKLKQNQAWLSTILTSLGEAIIVTDAEGAVQFINPKGEEISGYKQDEVIGNRLEEYIHFQDEKTGAPIIWNPIKEIKSQTGLDQLKVLNLISKSGSIIPIEETVAPILDDLDQLIGIVTIFRDVTRQREYQQRLREFSAYLQTVQENERTHIAREIHDELGQTLTALKMDVSWLRRKIEDIPIHIEQKMSMMTELIDQTILRVKKITSELRPGLLDDLGLAAAIEWQSDEFSKRTEIPCRVMIRPEDLTLNNLLSTSLFRVFQEALTNIMRHANATEVEVNLIKHTHEVELKIKDNGCGIQKSQINDPKSFGLIGIRERIQFIGGHVHIHGIKGKGTTIQVLITLTANAESGKS
ncbi:PAS domain S-box protein [candidate division KSB1 bacterium]|nr:PAS domain S-box protein [candidate division KSB1 bacterium]